MGIISAILGFSFVAAALSTGYSIISSVIFFIGIVIANIPEGLTPELTVALINTAEKLLKIGVLVSNMEVIETLGSVSVICANKTGNIT